MPAPLAPEQQEQQVQHRLNPAQPAQPEPELLALLDRKETQGQLDLLEDQLAPLALPEPTLLFRGQPEQLDPEPLALLALTQLFRVRLEQLVRLDLAPLASLVPPEPTPLFPVQLGQLA